MEDNSKPEPVLKNVVTSGNVTQAECLSSNIDFIRYDKMNNTLQVEFKGGKKYNYLNVPEDVFDLLMAAKSIGNFINTNVKTQFKVEKTDKDLFIENL